jgi:hypothetical protein
MARKRAGQLRRRAKASPIFIGRPRGAFTVLAVAPTAHVTVTRVQKGDASVSAKLNGADLRFVNDEAHAVVGRGQKNKLVWIVVGSEGDAWAIKVVEPSDADCGDGAKLDHSGRESGQCQFTT